MTWCFNRCFLNRSSSGSAGKKVVAHVPADAFWGGEKEDKMMGSKTGAVVVVMLTLAFVWALPAHGFVSVKYYTLTGLPGNDAFNVNPLNVAHALIAGGGDGDNDGPGSLTAKKPTNYPWRQYATNDETLLKPDGMADGMIFSVFEYLYATPSAPKHAEAVAAFNANNAALIAYLDQHPVYATTPNVTPSFLYAFAVQDSASNPVAVFIGIPAGATQAQIQATHDNAKRAAHYLRMLARITVSEHLSIAGNDLWAFIGLSGAGANQQSDIPAGADWTTLTYVPGFDMTSNTPVVDIVASMPGVDRSFANLLKPSGDFDGDGYTNQAEYDRILSNMIAEYNGTTPPPASPIPLDSKFSVFSREKKDEFIGRFISSAITNEVGGIEPGPPVISLSPKTYSVLETAGSATVTVVLDTAPAAKTVTINYATSNGTATAGADYTAASGTLSFTGSETSKTFSVTILNDAEAEGDETINLTLSSPTNGALDAGNATGTITILDDDIDSDGDGLLDIYETNDGIFNPPTSLGTDPDNWDTNGDGVADGLAYKLGFDPNTYDLSGQLPLAGAAGLLILAAGCGAVGVARLRKRNRK